jgi:UDP-N-acetylmuramoyl-tripeptide--D-alanyl-D-alanine ligase
VTTFTAIELRSALAQRIVRVDGDLPSSVAGVSTDSRQIIAGGIFVALSGDRFDGHAFVEESNRQGASLALVSRRVDAPIAQIIVDDVLHALQDLAAWHLERCPAMRLALTGSNGKTSTKELVRAALAGGLGPAAVVATAGNLNNHIGVPLTAFTVTPQHRAAVFEMGMNHFGEIARLCEIVHPTIGLITNIGSAHAANLGGIEGVARAKGELFTGLAPLGTAIVNVDDARCVRAARDHAGPRMTFSLDGAADVSARVTGVTRDGLSLTLTNAGRSHSGRIPLVGRHHARNAAGAVAMAIAAGIRFEDAVAGLASAAVSGGRLAWREREDGLVVLDDTYNANPDSLRAALDTLHELAQSRRTVAIVGDMLELDDPVASHEEMGRFVVERGVDALLCAGPLAKHVLDAAIAAGMPRTSTLWAPASDALAPLARKFVDSRDVVLVKGSRGARMERVVAALLHGGE